MENCLIVKCYLAGGGDGKSPQIRRFIVEPELIGNFVYLDGKVRGLYPQLLRADFTLHYVGQCFFLISNIFSI